MNKLDSLTERLTALENEAARRLDEVGVIATVELDYMNAFFKTVENKKQARFVTVSVVIRGSGTPVGEEYCLSLGVEIRGGKTDDNILEKDIASFNKMVDDTVARLGAAEDKTACVEELAREASEEYDKLVQKLTEDRKKQKVVSIIGMVLTGVGIIILFLVAALGG